ncbi:hypothetical protein FRC05_004889 [Tulasnella sp. 425]|nr:hypothetical protein FRC05_004889 [Tulasnella sp. 425]
MEFESSIAPTIHCDLETGLVNTSIGILSVFDCTIPLVETRLERLDFKLVKIYPFNPQRLRYAPSRYLVEFARFVLDCDASNNTSPNWEAAITILIRNHLNQRKNHASPADVERYRRIVQTLIDTACEPDEAIRLFHDEGIEEDVWARVMSGVMGRGGSIAAVGSSGKRAKLPSYVDNLVPKSHQVCSDRVRAALADFFDLHRFGINTWKELSNNEEAMEYLIESLNLVEKLSSSGSTRVVGSSPATLDASATPDSIKPVSRQLADAESFSAGGDVPSTTGPPTILTSDLGGDHSVQCDVTTPPTTWHHPLHLRPPTWPQAPHQAYVPRAARPRPRALYIPNHEYLFSMETPLPLIRPRHTHPKRRDNQRNARRGPSPNPEAPPRNAKPTQSNSGPTKIASRKFEHSYYAPFSTLNAIMCFKNPEERRRFDEGRTPLERQINSEPQREISGHVLRTVGPAEVWDEEVWSGG